jgi:predicted dienelactone hydrolase
MVELFEYLGLEIEKDKLSAREKENERYLSFLSFCYASPYADQNEREKFRQSLMPQSTEKQPEVKQEWNFDLLKQLKSRQKGG